MAAPGQPDHAVVKSSGGLQFAPPPANQPPVAVGGDGQSTQGAPTPSAPAQVSTNVQPGAPSAWPGGDWNPVNWFRGGDLLPQQDTLPGGIQPGQSVSDFMLSHLAQLGQGSEQIGHGLWNYGRSAGNYASGDFLNRILSWAGQAEPAWTPPALQQDPTFAGQQAATEQARSEMGPGMTALSAITGLRGLQRGAGGYGVGPATEAVVGKSVLNPALQGGVYLGGKSLVDDPNDPRTAAEQAGIGLGTGFVSGVLANKVLSPLLQAAVTKYYGGSTPEAITEKLGQSATDAEQQAAAKTADAQAQAAAKTTAAQQQAATQSAAADETLKNLRLNRKDLGFEIGTGNQNPTLYDLQSQLENLKNIKPENDPSGAVPILQQRIAKAFQSPDVMEAQGAASAARAKAAADAAAAQQQAEAEAATATAQAQDPAIAARAKAAQAEWLASAGRRVGLPGQNVPAEAAANLAQPGLSPEQIEAFTRIARSGEPGMGPQLWQTLAKLTGGGVGGWAGSLINEPAALAVVGQQVFGDLAKTWAPGGGAAATQAAIARGWPALTGEWPAAARGQLAGSDLLKTLYGIK